MKIAICEDDQGQARQVSQYVSQHPGKYLPKVFHSAEGLLAAYESGERFDLVFMDIQMEETDSGFQASKKIKMRYRDEYPLIVFMTILDEYAPYGYGIAWRFIVKPVDKGSIHHMIDQAVAELEKRRIQLETDDGKKVDIETRGIIYMQSDKKTVRVYTDKGIYVTKTALSAIIDKLPHGVFAQPHRSYCINFAHMADHKGGHVVMSDKGKVPIGKGKKEAFEMAHTVYLRGGRNG